MLGILCGAGIDLLGFKSTEDRAMSTPYGAPSAPLETLAIDDVEVLALRRHGVGHAIPPHKVNYRANLWALHDRGVTRCLAIHSVGTLDERFPPGSLALPSQLVDYTYGREHTYADGEGDLLHVDFEPPFDPALIAQVKAAADAANVAILADGVYAVTQGPRLETAAEVNRLGRDGCTMVGMTAMPEAGLARELAMPYASCAVAVNWAAGRDPAGEGIHSQIEAHAKVGFERVNGVLRALVAAESP